MFEDYQEDFFCENIEDYTICTFCKYDNMLIRIENLYEHMLRVHNLSTGNADQNLLQESIILKEKYSLKSIINLRKELSPDKQQEFYDKVGKDLSTLEATELTRAAILTFLEEYKKRIITMFNPYIKVNDIPANKLNNYLDPSEGVFYLFALIDIAKVEDITIYMLLARTWDWFQDDEDLKRGIEEIKNKILKNANNSLYEKASKCISKGKLILSTMLGSVKELLLLCHLTKKIIKRQST
ncbi:hypothetical protein cand_034880 [Cryptosporidium andersoni]|uniref:Uncharacterized protein n=1 Tax=Cryptosporidium andersoni TaxID=117008 RepID=A0A1J4MW02_9CRYT|nr:hypothetical protein cand_034880 [Cryptosporidium andersoni]